MSSSNQRQGSKALTEQCTFSSCSNRHLQQEAPDLEQELGLEEDQASRAAGSPPPPLQAGGAEEGEALQGRGWDTGRFQRSRRTRAGRSRPRYNTDGQ